MQARPLAVVEEGTPDRRPRRWALSLLVSSRPKQWTKNLFVVTPLVFSGAADAADIVWALLAFASFCLASSALYLINDIADRDLDRLHERKRHRPIASGELSVGVARTAAVVMGAAAFALLAFVPLAAMGVLAAYVVTTLAYSWWLKHVALLDVLIVAGGFVLRVAAGSYAIDVRPSEWLLLCTLFLALFLAFAKRRHELLLLGDGADEHRPVLGAYTRELLDEFLSASMIGALLSYSMYTFFSETAEEHGGLVLTIPFAVFGIFRYMLLVHVESEGGSPEELLLRDRPLQVAVVLWGLLAAAVVYGERLISST